MQRGLKSRYKFFARFLLYPTRAKVGFSPATGDGNFHIKRRPSRDSQEVTLLTSERDDSARQEVEGATTKLNYCAAPFLSVEFPLVDMGKVRGEWVSKTDREGEDK